MKTIIEVRHIVTGEVVKRIDVTGKSQRLIDFEAALALNNMCDDDYCTTIAEVPHG